MKSIGWLLVIFGAGSFVLNLIGMEFRYLMWIDSWGVEVGWAIRGALIVVGGALLFFGMKSEAAGAAAAPAEPTGPAAPAAPEPAIEAGPAGGPGFEPQPAPERE
ncbi:MAG: hypothetical protein JSU82_17870 [Rhodospirillales bacterium]|nr:MAG: hypothetical protein JSU82_17870 [Rhodospirillales bacterium]